MEKKLLLVEQNTKEIKEGASIIKLNISSLHKAVIPWLKCMETLKNHSFSCITCLIPKIHVHKINHLIRHTVTLGTSTCSQLKVSLPSKRKRLLLKYSVDDEVSALARSAFYKNLLIEREISVHCLY